MKKGVITYDISKTRERSLLAKLLQGYCIRIQFSVFEFELSNDVYEEMFKKIVDVFNKYKINSILYKDHNETYSIRIYILCDSCMKKTYCFENKKSKYEIEEDIY